MITGLYSAATGLLAAELNQEVIARNLAHVNVPGFRRAVVPFETLENELQAINAGEDVNDLVGTHPATIAIDFSPGVIDTTGRSLDVAIMGDGFFVVEGEGGPLYTRNGSFHINERGELVNSSGMLIQGGGGPLVIPSDAAPSTITIAKDGTVSAGDLEIGQLDIVAFADNSKLEQVGTTLFAAPDGVQPEASAAVIRQGARELSNVNSVDELVRMIVGMRHYEASQRAMKALTDAIQQNTDPNAG
jgi:flagellar basal body rod protein FlgG